MSRLLEMVRKARRAPGQFQRLTDRIAVWFVPLISTVAIATAAYRGYTEGIDAGILSGLAVVLIACPCAFGLATPMAIWTAMGRAARGHVLFRSGQALEQLARVESMYFDKTGTLTSGDSDVEALILADTADRREVLAIADVACRCFESQFFIGHSTLCRRRNANQVRRCRDDYSRQRPFGLRRSRFPPRNDLLG